MNAAHVKWPSFRNGTGDESYLPTDKWQPATRPDRNPYRDRSGIQHCHRNFFVAAHRLFERGGTLSVSSVGNTCL